MLNTDIQNINDAFQLAAMTESDNTIGVLSEKTLHSVLKYCFCADASKHEIKFKGYVADILIERDGERPLIIEIQTRQAFRLVPKLLAYSDDAEIIIVLPVMAQKQLMWVSPETGEIKKGGKTSRPKNIYHALKEIYGIREFINNDNISVCVPLIDAEEYRNLNGRDKSGKRGSTRKDILPKSILELIWLKERNDYEKLIPNTLGERFTAEEFARASKTSLNDARCAIRVLNVAKVLFEDGKDGSKKLWMRKLKAVSDEK